LVSQYGSIHVPKIHLELLVATQPYETIADTIQKLHRNLANCLDDVGHAVEFCSLQFGKHNYALLNSRSVGAKEI
jgi:hypothetical protein